MEFHPDMKDIKEPPGLDLTPVMRSLTYSTALFAAFIAFGFWMHDLKCGYWCNLFFGHS